MKDFAKFVIDYSNTLAQAVGYISLTLIGMSLYPPLSFIPKFVLLFALTH